MHMELNSNKDVLVVAPAGYETVIQVNKLEEYYSEANSVDYQGGGHGGNLAYYLSNLGVRCALYTHWGDDLPGIKAQETMLKAGVDVALCRTFRGETSQSNFLINIGGTKKTIMNFGTALSMEADNAQVMPLSKLLYTSLLPVKPALTLIKRVNEMGGEVVLGFQIPTSVASQLGCTHEKVKEALPLTRHAIGSYSVVAEEFKSDLKAPELVLWLKDKFSNLKTVVITDGKNGSYAYANGELIHQPAFPIVEVDSTGAGDQFSAIFLRDYILRGIPLASSMRRAALYSAMVCSKQGSRVLVTDDEIDILCGVIGK